MSSKNGPHTAGTDGSDYSHREIVSMQYQLSILNKSRLKWCIFFHFILFIMVVSKWLPCILDTFDLCIVELKELHVPKPLLWECIWCISFFASILGLAAIRGNCNTSMQQYMFGIIVFGFGPLCNAIVHYFADVWTYMFAGSKEVKDWQGYPYGLLWHGFIILALQVHLFSVYFALKLFFIWTANSRNTKIIIQQKRKATATK